MLLGVGGSNREKRGEFAALLGVVFNFLLSGVKFAVGLLSGSVSVLADAANNLTDAAASIVTTIGFHIARRPADESHPYGHARSEQIAALFVSISILLVSVEVFRGAVEKIFSPAYLVLTPIACVLLALAAVCKFFLYLFYRRQARAISSGALRAAARDSLGDAGISLVVLVSQLLSDAVGPWVDGALGALIAVLLFFSGLSSLRETLDPLLGSAPSGALVRRIEEKILSYDTVLGLHDLLIHSYGASRTFASVHVEFAASQDLLMSHEIIDTIERDFAAEEGIELVIHLDPVVTDDAFAGEMKARLCGFLKTVDERLSLHDFRVIYKKEQTNFIFDLSVPANFPVPDTKLCDMCRKFLADCDTSYYALITVDRSYIRSLDV